MRLWQDSQQGPWRASSIGADGGKSSVCEPGRIVCLSGRPDTGRNSRHTGAAGAARRV